MTAGSGNPVKNYFPVTYCLVGSSYAGLGKNWGAMRGCCVSLRRIFFDMINMINMIILKESLTFF